MQILENINLAEHSTMRLGGIGRYYCEVTDRQEVIEAIDWAVEHQVPPIMIGDGSNIVWRDEGFEGLVIKNCIMGYEVFAEDDQNHYVTVGGGENWDAVVARTAAAGLSGIEALSLIPGTTGATPVQNVGAYGQDIAQTLATIVAYDLHTRQFVTLANSDCAFAYRSSRFNGTDRGRYFITNLTLHLTTTLPQPPFYTALHYYFEMHGVTNFSAQATRDAVIAIRQEKLPDPAVVANNGSFFGNPIISDGRVQQLLADYPTMPHWPTGEYDQVKIPAAWLIEQAGFKNHIDTETGMATWPAQPLVLVNRAAKSTNDLLIFKQKIVDAIQAKFDITLEQEPELLP